MERTSVVIIGGSLVGLSASLFLAWRGVPHILVEKHRGSSPHPRAIGFTESSLEHFRTVGIADRIPQVAPEVRLRRVTVTSLTGEILAETDWTPGQQNHRNRDLSPCTGAAIAQDKLEPILRQAALDLGADLRLGVEMVTFAQTENNVTVRVRPLDGPTAYDIAADYLIAADGADSPIREGLGITRSGVGHLRKIRSVLFRCREADAALASGVQQYEIEQEDFRAFLTTYSDGRWALMFGDDRERSEADLRAAILRALGRDMDFEIITTGRWEMAGRIADRYARGRIFLAGDAAHQLPPTRGGFGANTGIGDVWNLAWRLQLVLAGTSSTSLLDTYDAERRPIGWLRHQQTFSRPDYAKWVDQSFRPDPLLGDDAMELGQLVRSAAVIGAGPELAPAASPIDWAGQPGTRAPHVWIERHGARLSTLDLFGNGFVALTQDPAWLAAIDDLPIEGLAVGSDMVFPDVDAFATQFGVPPAGATLVRPDGIVAWRHLGPAEPDELRRAFARVSHLTDR
ncbi:MULTISPECIES: FAD-dependent monooxygenase [Bradyrhizobium]|jgi:putative polyketide hydroxylase|uniref:FAD-dependent monooxygenase n=2 Tax=Nitrobacteraceae TaxID=41294 RepID=UPI0003A02259|nr:FAD-dependent monooxygenase [Bradyrhizobium denitrificans]MCL8482891.1 FAD-dependent monooxygenase [Bradyrhizobium denitrificans]